MRRGVLSVKLRCPSRFRLRRLGRSCASGRATATGESARCSVCGAALIVHSHFARRRPGLTSRCPSEEEPQHEALIENDLQPIALELRAHLLPASAAAAVSCANAAVPASNPHSGPRPKVLVRG